MTLTMAQVPVPGTPVARRALDVVTTWSTPALVNHCARSYLFAASRALIDGMTVDHELLYVASLLHDLALEVPFDSHRLPFEDAGAALVSVFATGAGWSRERADHAGAVVVAHMRGTDPAVDPEGHLLDVATGLDISGRGFDTWPAELLAEIVESYPRLDLADRFTTFFRDQASRKPDSSAARAMAGGLTADPPCWRPRTP